MAYLLYVLFFSNYYLPIVIFYICIGLAISTIALGDSPVSGYSVTLLRHWVNVREKAALCGEEVEEPSECTHMVWCQEVSDRPSLIQGLCCFAVCA